MNVLKIQRENNSPKLIDIWSFWLAEKCRKFVANISDWLLERFFGWQRPRKVQIKRCWWCIYRNIAFSLAKNGHPDSLCSKIKCTSSCDKHCIEATKDFPRVGKNSNKSTIDFRSYPNWIVISVCLSNFCNFWSTFMVFSLIIKRIYPNAGAICQMWIVFKNNFNLEQPFLLNPRLKLLLGRLRLCKGKKMGL